MVNENHWPCVLTNLETGVGLYKDSIGREVPPDFEDTFSNFFQAICKAYKKNYDFIKSMQIAHENNQQKARINVDIFV